MYKSGPFRNISNYFPTIIVCGNIIETIQQHLPKETCIFETFNTFFSTLQGFAENVQTYVCFWEHFRNNKSTFIPRKHIWTFLKRLAHFCHITEISGKCQETVTIEQHYPREICMWAFPKKIPLQKSAENVQKYDCLWKHYRNNEATFIQTNIISEYFLKYFPQTSAMFAHRLLIGSATFNYNVCLISSKSLFNKVLGRFFKINAKKWWWHRINNNATINLC